MTTAPAFAWRTLGLVALGGAVGAAARAALLWPGVFGESLAIPVTAAVNVAGAGLLGLLVGVLGARHPALRSFFGTGMLGGFTTFSAFALQVATSTPWAAVLLALATMVLGVLAAGAGLRIGRALAHRRGGPDAPELAE